MPICSYLVIPEKGEGAHVRAHLEALPGCEVVPSVNRDVFILVTDTADLPEEEALRLSVESMDGIQTLLLTFGEIDPHTELGDPLAMSGRRRRTSRPISE